MKKQLLVLGVFLIVLGCKKKRTSYWSVNDESFSTDTVVYNRSPGGTSLRTPFQENGFSIVLIPGEELPKSGSYIISNPRASSSGLYVTFYYRSKAYIPSQPGSAVIQASASDDKAILTIPPTWFKQSDSTFKDSVIIQGILSEQ